MRELSIFALEDSKSPISEAFRTLRTNIQFSGIDKKIRSMVITSSGPEEGKTTISMNIAASIAQTGNKVLLVDSDLRKPTLHRYFDIDDLRGLTNILVQDIDYSEAIYESDNINGLYIIGSGPIPPNPAELLGSNKMKNFVKNMTNEYDMVILDAPPIGFVTDGALLSTIVDGTIFVCTVGETDVNVAKRSKDLLSKVKANILGVVLNKVPMNGGGYYKYHYSQYYGYSYYGSQKAKGK